MSYAGKVGQWNDINCGTSHGYVCMTNKGKHIFCYFEEILIPVILFSSDMKQGDF